jgi:hypothetical protein
MATCGRSSGLRAGCSIKVTKKKKKKCLRDEKREEEEKRMVKFITEKVAQ